MRAGGSPRSALLIHVDRRRPGALFVLAQAVVVERRAVVAVAGIYLHAGAGLVVRAAQAAGVDGRRGLLDRAHVVEDVAPVDREVGIVELDHAAGLVARTFEAAPGVFDERRNRFTLTSLRADADDLDAGDQVPLVARVVTLAAAERLQPVGRQRLHGMLGTTGQLLERSHGA